MISKCSPLPTKVPLVTRILLSAIPLLGPPATRCGVNIERLGVRCARVHMPLSPDVVQESTHLSSALLNLSFFLTPPATALCLGPPITSGSKAPSPEEAFTRSLIWPPIFPTSTTPTEGWAFTRPWCESAWSFCATSARPSAYLVPSCSRYCSVRATLTFLVHRSEGFRGPGTLEIGSSRRASCS